MKKIIIILLIIVFSFSSTNIISAYTGNGSYGEEILSGKEVLSGGWNNNDVIFEAIIDVNVDKMIPKMIFYNSESEKVQGIITYPNYSEMKEGLFDLQWVFTPNSDIYEIKSGVIHFKLYKHSDDKEEPIIKSDVSNITEESTTLSLTASSLMLSTTDLTYDINIDNKEVGSTYKWSSSNEKVAKVNSKGIVSSVANGTCEIICTVTNSDNSTEELKSTVNVGTDDNFPVLNENDLLLSVGDSFDLNIGNKISGSSYVWKTTDKTVAKVNTKFGLTSMIGVGMCEIICNITTEDKQVIVLICQVEVTE